MLHAIFHVLEQPEIIINTYVDEEVIERNPRSTADGVLQLGSDELFG